MRTSIKYCALLALSVGFGAIFQPLFAQTHTDGELRQGGLNEEAAVIQVAQDLFDAMRAGDGDKVLAQFVEGAVLQSVGERQGVPAIRTTPITGFAEAVGQPHEQVWNEIFWDTEVRIDGRLASMWMKYAFYTGDTFSHCGVDSFQLFNGEDGWKITYLADTRQLDGCDIPESVRPGGNDR